MSSYSKFGLNEASVIQNIELKQSEKAVWLYAEIKVGKDQHPKKMFLFYPKVVYKYDQKAKKSFPITEGQEVKAARKRWREDVATVVASAIGSPVKSVLDAALATQPESPQDFIRAALAQLKGSYKLVDVFLEYDKEGRLGFPRDSNDGLFICPHTTTGWRKDDENGLVYIKGERKHLFTRSAKYMKSKKAEKGATDFVAEPKQPKKPEPKYMDDDDLPF